MSFLTTAARYDRDTLLVRIRGLKWNKGWRPYGVILHNTGGPNLTQAKASPEAAREAAFGTYYRSMHWHSGPHATTWWDDFYELCDLEQNGVHASCYNNHPGQGYYGFEMLGDYDRGVDDWNSGLGLQVQNNAIFLCAAIFNQLGIPVNKETLRPHSDCVVDHHACPGNLVDMNLFRANVITTQATIRGIPTITTGASLPLPPIPPAANDHPMITAMATGQSHDIYWVQTALNKLGATPQLDVDDKPGPATHAAVEAFQKAAGITVDGLVGPQTDAALEAALQKQLAA